MVESGIVTVAREQATSVLGVLTLAFATDPVNRYFLPDPGDYLKWYPLLAMALGERGFDHGAVTAMADFGAAAMWLPPGVEPDPQTLASLTIPQPPEREAAGAALRAEMRRYHPTSPHWYLWMIGVDPRRQGLGLGSALLKHTLAKVDAAGADAYLESSNPKNVPLYERFGFEPLGVIRALDVPPMTPMLRRARR